MSEGDTGQELVIRADANRQIGTGHLMRCMALAQAWGEAGGEVAFVTARDGRPWLTLLQEEGFETHEVSMSYPAPGDWETLREVLSSVPNAWVILDGYHFDSAYHDLIRGTGHRLLVIDDMGHLDRYAADVILNQNLHATSLRYTCEPGCRLLLGPQYVLLRQEFLERRGGQREIRPLGGRILVTLGGVDPYNVTSRVLLALQALDREGVEIRAVVGQNNTHSENLKAISNRPAIPIEHIRDPDSMSALMAWADLAISAGGSTGWELAFMGVPSLVLIMSDNQVPIAEGLDAEGVARNLGWHDRLREDELVGAVVSLLGDGEKRARMAQRGQALVDGGGTARVVEFLNGGEGT